MISIVIPALNEEKLLSGCLESLRNQDYCDEYEIIVADNGSNDKTADIARSLGAKVIACSKKKSVFYARQVGADAARGDSALKTTLKAEINQEAWSTLNSDTSRPFEKPKSGRVAVKVINHLGDEVMKVFKV